MTDSQQYSIRLPQKVYGGVNAIENLRGIASKFTKVVLFTDKSIGKAGLVARPLKLLKEAGVLCEVLDNVPTEPMADDAAALISDFRKLEADLIVAVGGGSVMDIAKLAAVLDTGDYTLRDLLEDPARAQKQVKTVMIPTTAGTGSEATPNSIVTVPEKELKVGIVNECMVADYIILDAYFTQNLPYAIAASTGIDALCHAIECYTGKKANPFSDIFAMEAMGLIFSNLEAACIPAGSYAAKSAMLTASFYAGIAIAAAGTTAVHALAYPLGGKYRIAHGVSNAMLLAPVMKFNEDAVRSRLAAIHDRLNGGEGSQEEKSVRVIERITKLVNDLGIPTSLTQMGVPAQDLEILVEKAMEVKRLLDNNAKRLEEKDVRAIYQQIL